MMLKRIKKGWGFLRFFLLARKKIWSRPKQSKILIFDASGQEVLMTYLAPWNPEVLHLSGEQINVRVLLASIFRCGRRFDAYVDAYIELVRPNLIVTFIDNNPNFYALSIRHPNIKTLFIQNGYRANFGKIFENPDVLRSDQNRFQVDYMMTFGNRIGAEYSKHISGAVKPMGSLKNNLFRNSQTKKPGTIAFISQYRDTPGFILDGLFCSRHAFFEQADKIILTFLLQYAKKHDKTVFIVPCAGYRKDGTLEKERAYYDNLLKHNFAFSEWLWPGSSYDSADSAEVVVSIDSTFAYESAARGNRTAIFSIRSALLGIPGHTFGWPESYPDDGTFWTNRPDTKNFERILDHLFAML